MVDYAKRIADLRRLGAPGSGATEAERALANEKADELERKHRVNVSSPITDDTTTTSRDGRGYHNPWMYEPPTYMWDSDGRFNPFARPPGFDQARYDEAVRQTENLFRNQHRWNKPPDEDDLIADEYKHDPGPEDDEDYGYDIYEGGEYDDG